MINSIKLYIVIISVNPIARLLLSVLMALLIRIIFIKYHLIYDKVYATEPTPAEKDYYSCYYNNVYRKNILVMSKSGQEMPLFLVTDYVDQSTGVRAYRLTKSEQAHPYLETFISNEQYLDSCRKTRNEVPLHYRIINKYQKIPSAETSSPVLPALSNLDSLSTTLNTFDYNKLFTDYAHLVKDCPTDKQKIVLIMQFLQDAMPEIVLSKAPSEILDSHSAINKFIFILRSKVRLYTKDDRVTMAELHAGITVYNSSIMTNSTDNLQELTQAFSQTKYYLL